MVLLRSIPKMYSELLRSCFSQKIVRTIRPFRRAADKPTHILERTHSGSRCSCSSMFDMALPPTTCRGTQRQRMLGRTCREHSQVGRTRWIQRIQIRLRQKAKRQISSSRCFLLLELTTGVWRCPIQTGLKPQMDPINPEHKIGD